LFCLATGQYRFDNLKSGYRTGYILSKKLFVFKGLKVRQVLTKRRGAISVVTEGPSEQFQIE
jgi:hypothetical protein